MHLPTRLRVIGFLAASSPWANSGTSAAPLTASTPVCQNGAVFGGRSCYVVVAGGPNAFSREEAEKKCAARALDVEGRLATIMSEEDQKEIDKLLAGTQGSYYIGYRASGPACTTPPCVSQWVGTGSWPSGLVAAAYNKFPQDQGGPDAPCFVVSASRQEWVPVNCSSPHGYICHWPVWSEWGPCQATSTNCSVFETNRTCSIAGQCVGNSTAQCKNNSISTCNATTNTSTSAGSTFQGPTTTATTTTRKTHTTTKPPHLPTAGHSEGDTKHPLEPPAKDNTQLYIIIGASAGSLVLLLTLTVCCCCIRQRRNLQKRRNQESSVSVISSMSGYGSKHLSPTRFVSIPFEETPLTPANTTVVVDEDSKFPPPPPSMGYQNVGGANTNPAATQSPNTTQGGLQRTASRNSLLMTGLQDQSAATGIYENHKPMQSPDINDGDPILASYRNSSRASLIVPPAVTAASYNDRISGSISGLSASSLTSTTYEKKKTGTIRPESWAQNASVVGTRKRTRPRGASAPSGQYDSMISSNETLENSTNGDNFSISQLSVDGKAAPANSGPVYANDANLLVDRPLPPPPTPLGNRSSVYELKSRPLPPFPQSVDAQVTATSTPNARFVRDTMRKTRGSIQRSAFVRLNLIGRGSFCQVYQGILRQGDNFSPIAIKEIRTADTSAVENVRQQAAHMKTLHHSNLVQLIGATDHDPSDGTIHVIMELMPLGDLATYLRVSKQQGHTIPLSERLWYTHQIARGMEYLHSRGIVHRDLAARNCMLAPPSHSFGYPVLKVSHFGLSELIPTNCDHLSPDSEVTGKNTVLHMAPESIDTGVFSPASDVWAYGVCLWEIFSDAAQPYAQTERSTPTADLPTGIPLDRPELCPESAYTLMYSCWAHDPLQRPNFTTLTDITADLFVPECPGIVKKRVVAGEVVLVAETDTCMDQHDHDYETLNTLVEHCVQDVLSEGSSTPTEERQ